MGGVREKDEGEGGERWRVRRWGWEICNRSSTFA